MKLKLENYSKPTPAKLGLAIKGICASVVTGSMFVGASEQTLSSYQNFLNQNTWLIITVAIVGAVADEVGKMLTGD